MRQFTVIIKESRTLPYRRMQVIGAQFDGKQDGFIALLDGTRITIKQNFYKPKDRSCNHES